MHDPKPLTLEQINNMLLLIGALREEMESRAFNLANADEKWREDEGIISTLRRVDNYRYDLAEAVDALKACTGLESNAAENTEPFGPDQFATIANREHNEQIKKGETT